MSKTKRTASKTDELDLNKLSPAEAHSVLILLLAQHGELKETVSDIARVVRETPDFEDLATEISAALNKVTEAAVFGSSGRQRSGGYCEPEEAAATLIGEEVDPYIERLEKLLKKKDESKALVLCQAIMVALYRFEHSGDYDELEECMSECSQDTASWAHKIWLAAGDTYKAADGVSEPGRELPEQFVHKYLPDWDWLRS